MNCVRCKHGTLFPTRLDDGVGPVGDQCRQCQGVMLALGPYLDWVRGLAHAQPSASTPTPPASATAVTRLGGESADTKAALPCPKCSRIMLRYSVQADRAHGLDFCFHCEAVWLDGGEWQYLQGQGLHTQISSIATEPYQRRLREQALRDAALQRFRQSIGDAAFEQVHGFAQWLQTLPSPQADAILRYLGQQARR